jgi:hypothetical protein
MITKRVLNRRKKSKVANIERTQIAKSTANGVFSASFDGLIRAFRARSVKVKTEFSRPAGPIAKIGLSPQYEELLKQFDLINGEIKELKTELSEAKAILEVERTDRLAVRANLTKVDTLPRRALKWILSVVIVGLALNLASSYIYEHWKSAPNSPIEVQSQQKTPRRLDA